MSVTDTCCLIAAFILVLPFAVIWLLAAGVEWSAAKAGFEVAHGWN
jgi:hypothetical protein